jgi:cephalosporin-C deacetylase
MQYDLPLADLRDYRPDVAEPADFDEFWAAQLAVSGRNPVTASFEPFDSRLETVEVFDVTFSGHGGAAIRGWLLLPRHRSEPLPAIVEYVGYGGGRGLAHESLLWSAAGYAHFVMDSRGQGSGHKTGDSPDPGDTGDPSVPGFMTRGIRDPESYYFVRLFIDAARAVDAVRLHSAVDGDRILVTGGSQGGGLTLAAVNLADGVVGAMVDYPFLAHFERAVAVTDESPYAELSEYCRAHRDHIDDVFRTLSYVDVVNHAKRATVPGLFSVGLADLIAPPSTVFAAYNWYGGPASIEVYPYNEHEGGGAHHEQVKLRFAADVLR